MDSGRAKGAKGDGADAPYPVAQNKANYLRFWARNRDRDEFVRRMRALRNGLEKDIPDFGKAYENMYRIVGGL